MGIKFLASVLVEADGIEGGLHIKDISGIIKFRPIEILKEEDKFTYISSGDKNNNITIKAKVIKNIKRFKCLMKFTKYLLI